MIVIIEGPDGAGKTTLAEHLSKRYWLSYHHEGPPPPGIEPLYHYAKLLDNARHPRGSGVVFDRFALGERVYGPVLRGRDAIGLDGWRVFKRLLKASGAISVLCLPSYEVCHASWASGRHELILDRQRFNATYSHWVALRAEFDIIYDYRTSSGLELDLHQMNTMIWPPPVIGDPMAKYVLVGDVGSDKNCPVDLAFFGTTDSAAYLTAALDLAGFQENELAWVNAYTLEGYQQRLPDDKRYRLIALGGRAVAACKRQNLDCHAVPHPQYWRRFHHHDMQKYADMLKGARA